MNLEKLVKMVGNELLQRQLKIVTAESCTGGGLSYWLTSISGSSGWFERGFITYSNEAKIALLGVSADTLATFGAVSEETAHEMAEGALKFSLADVSIAITGIAGPEGGSEEKPVGTVWMGIARRGKATETQLMQLSGERNTIRTDAIRVALEKILVSISA